MGGGTSNLFYGTKGSREEYQYTLFVDEKSVEHTGQVGTGSVGAMSEAFKRAPHKQEILPDTIIEKCYEYYDGKLSAQQFADWLDHILSYPLYSIARRLRRLIEVTLQKFQRSLVGSSQQTMESFTLLVNDFEKLLHQLL